jgi:hypothetical protein
MNVRVVGETEKILGVGMDSRIELRMVPRIDTEQEMEPRMIVRPLLLTRTTTIFTVTETTTGQRQKRRYERS